MAGSTDGEYDYSPDAERAYQQKLASVGNWTHEVSKHKPVNPFLLRDGRDRDSDFYKKGKTGTRVRFSSTANQRKSKSSTPHKRRGYHTDVVDSDSDSDDSPPPTPTNGPSYGLSQPTAWRPSGGYVSPPPVQYPQQQLPQMPVLSSGIAGQPLVPTFNLQANAWEYGNPGSIAISIVTGRPLVPLLMSGVTGQCLVPAFNHKIQAWEYCEPPETEPPETSTGTSQPIIPNINPNIKARESQKPVKNPTPPVNPPPAAPNLPIYSESRTNNIAQADTRARPSGIIAQRGGSPAKLQKLANQVPLPLVPQNSHDVPHVGGEQRENPAVDERVKPSATTSRPTQIGTSKRPASPSLVHFAQPGKESGRASKSSSATLPSSAQPFVSKPTNLQPRNTINHSESVVDTLKAATSPPVQTPVATAQSRLGSLLGSSTGTQGHGSLWSLPRIGQKAASKGGQPSKYGESPPKSYMPSPPQSFTSLVLQDASGSMPPSLVMSIMSLPGMASPDSGGMPSHRGYTESLADSEPFVS